MNKIIAHRGNSWNHPEMIHFFEEKRKKVSSRSELVQLLEQDAPVFVKKIQQERVFHK